MGKSMQVIFDGHGMQPLHTWASQVNPHFKSSFAHESNNCMYPCTAWWHRMCSFVNCTNWLCKRCRFWFFFFALIFFRHLVLCLFLLICVCLFESVSSLQLIEFQKCGHRLFSVGAIGVINITCWHLLDY